MKVSMYIVKKWLHRYHPEAHISKGEQDIIGVRYFTENVPLKKEFLYIGLNRDFIETDKRGVICANSGDLILLDTEDIYEVFNEMQEMLEFYNEWEMRIMRMTRENSSVGEILEATARTLGHDLVLTDASHDMLAEAHIRRTKRSYRLPGGRLSDSMIRTINEVLKEHADDRLPFPGPRGKGLDLIRNFFDEDAIIGWLVVLNIEKEKEKEALNQLVESFCRLLEFWFRINKEALRLSDQSGLFLDILEGKAADPETIRSRMEGIGWYGKPEMQLAKIHFTQENLFHITYLVRTIPSVFSSSYAFRFQDQLLMITNLSLLKERDSASWETELARFAKRYRASIGLSYPFTDAANLFTYYEQADIALSCGGRETGRLYSCEDYALFYLKNVLNENLRADVTHKALDELKAYDQKQGTEYYMTLASYLLTGCDQTRTAGMLHIHRNSLIYRIRKIQELLELDLTDDRLRLYLLLSYFIREREFGV